jgi:hypothetical protein
VGTGMTIAGSGPAAALVGVGRVKLGTIYLKAEIMLH